MDKKTQGAWIFHHTSKLNHVTHTGEYENISLAGKAGILLSSLSVSDDTQLSYSQVEALARAAGLHTRLEVPLLLKILEKHRLVERSGNRVSTLGLTAAGILTHTTDIFEAQDPAPEENAALELAEVVSQAPRLESDAGELIGDVHHLPKDRVRDLLSSASQIGFVDTESLDDSTRLLFNGNLFRRGNIAKVQAVLSSITPADEKRIVEVDSLLRQNGTLELSKVRTLLTKTLFEKL